MCGWFFLLAASVATPPDIGSAALRAFFVLIFLIALLVLAARYGRTWMQRLFPRPQGEMRVLETLHLEPRRTLYLIRLRGRDFWIASHENGIDMLEEFMPPANAAPAALPAKTPPPEPLEDDNA